MRGVRCYMVEKRNARLVVMVKPSVKEKLIQQANDCGIALSAYLNLLIAQQSGIDSALAFDRKPTKSRGGSE